MTTRVHTVIHYNYSYDAQTGGPGRLQLWGDPGKIADIIFIDENSALPATILTPDLSSATAFFRCSAMTGFIQMLRSEKCVCATISDQGIVSVFHPYGLADSLVVCSSCAPDLLAAKTQGVLEAMQRLVSFCGADALPEVCPVTIHLNDDSYCGPYQSGKTTGYFSCDASGRGHVCLYDVEKENRTLPFTVENASTIRDQLLVVHEAMHAWFVGRQENYRIMEPFCKMTSFIISEMEGGPEYCPWFSSTPDDHPDVLMKYLCQIGMNSQRAAEILQCLAKSAAEKGRALSDAEFAGIVTGVLGTDAVPAFESAGILP